MFNFLEPKLCPKVFCSSPVSDNYEASNLLSENYNTKIRGFIAYTTIKPPVELVFEFICSINIRYIVLNTTVGTQKCTGIELFAKSDHCSEWMSISKAIYDEPGLVICNSKFYTKDNPPQHVPNTYKLLFFKRDAFRVFLNAKYLKVVIIRTYKSVPCLGSIQVYGIPSKTCSKTTIETVNRLMKESTKVDSVLQISTEFKVPEDFKDDLTYEIMTIPMTLPSGKTIDQKTLEKHNNGEISLGRKPCDPFTGIKFTSSIKPVLNVSLKSRIDMFLLHNSSRPEYQNLERTIGRLHHVANGASSSEQQYTYSKVNVTKRNESENSCDLDEVMAKAKRSKHFVDFNQDNNSDKNVCIKCKSKLNSLYEIACRHLFCRPCLFQIRTASKCSECEIKFTNSDVQKCNF